MSDTMGSVLEPAVQSPVSRLSEAGAWYADAVIYQLHVRSFYDSNGDGIGDFPGALEKLDYIASLGVTAIWLLPFYPSPLRDEGYDIADYKAVNPMYGTLDDFRRFLDAAHQRGLRVITELVINHTSDQHPWFQRARRAPPGSPDRDFYVWSDTPDRYPEVRVIFKDFEASNWTWDATARQYFWHRFYSHQPDLNYDHPPVQAAILEIFEFWLNMGIDGMRLDAIPYLFERDGTNGESLPETHQFLRRLRKLVDDEFPDRMLLAEANQWPDETAAYFGSGDECHMCFHFPLMPRLFMAVQQEERLPIVDILQQTPLPPAGCQWAIFLRNHDELTLEMVTDEERDSMYRFFAADPQARINAGVRRRLAPLLRNDRRKLELMHALLFSLPGTPVMYYGDEIRMGDNIYLHDRDSVRTPMQWTSDRNAGFSRANPQRLFLPPIVDPAYHYQTRNVETDEQSPHSLLWWLRRVIRLRQRFQAFGRGELEFLFPDNPRILAFIRRFEEQTVLVVANLSRLSQFVELDLSRFRGRSPVELFGQNRFPAIGELPYFLTIGPHGFYWLQLEWPHGEEVRRSPAELPVLHVLKETFDLFHGLPHPRLRDELGAYIVRQTWHAASMRVIRSAEVQEAIALPGTDDDGSRYFLCIVRTEYTEGEPSLYLVPLIETAEARAGNILQDRPTAGLARVVSRTTRESRYLCDATAEREFWQRLAERLAQGDAATDGAVGLTARLAPDCAGLGGESPASIVPLWRTTTSRAAVAAVGKRWFLKLLRLIEPGVHPEAEIGLALNSMGDASSSPRFLGSLEYVSRDMGPVALLMCHEFQVHERTLEDFCREDLRRFLEARAADGKPPPDNSPPMSFPGLAETPSVESAGSSSTIPTEAGSALEAFGPVVIWFSQFGVALGRAHLALAGMVRQAAFAPEPFSTHYRRSVYQGFRGAATRSLECLRLGVRQTDPLRNSPRAVDLLGRAAAIDECFRGLLRFRTPLLRIRCHGDLFLGQVLLTGHEVRIVDWEGNPLRPLSERRLKRSVLRDLARLACSIRLVASSVVEQWLAETGDTTDRAISLRGWAAEWERVCGTAFLHSYRDTVAGSSLLPADPGELHETFLAFLLHAACKQLIRSAESNQITPILAMVEKCHEVLAEVERLKSGPR